MVKYWKANGEEQKLLESLLEKKEISSSSNPNLVHKKYSIFGKFSLKNFKKHFYKTVPLYELHGN